MRCLVALISCLLNVRVQALKPIVTTRSILVKKSRIDVPADAVRLTVVLTSETVPLLLKSGLNRSQAKPLALLEKVRLAVAVVLTGLGVVPVMSDVGHLTIALVVSSVRMVSVEVPENVCPAGDQVKLLVDV